MCPNCFLLIHSSGSLVLPHLDQTADRSDSNPYDLVCFFRNRHSLHLVFRFLGLNQAREILDLLMGGWALE